MRSNQHFFLNLATTYGVFSRPFFSLLQLYIMTYLIANILHSDLSKRRIKTSKCHPSDLQVRCPRDRDRISNMAEQVPVGYFLSRNLIWQTVFVILDLGRQWTKAGFTQSNKVPPVSSVRRGQTETFCRFKATCASQQSKKKTRLITDKNEIFEIVSSLALCFSVYHLV